MLKKLRTYLVSGLLILVPVTLTIYIIIHTFTYLDTILRPILEPSLEYFGLFYVNGMGFVLLIFILIVIGMFASNWFGKKLITIGENIIKKIPLVSKIYKAIQQISYAVIGGHKSIFKGVVLVEYPRREMYSIGFWTEKSAGEVTEKLHHPVMYHIFIPTTPNPTSGYLLIIPEKDIIFLDMSVEDALKLIISGGSVIPGIEDVQDKDKSREETTTSEHDKNIENKEVNEERKTAD